MKINDEGSLVRQLEVELLLPAFRCDHLALRRIGASHQNVETKAATENPNDKKYTPKTTTERTTVSISVFWLMNVDGGVVVTPLISAGGSKDNLCCPICYTNTHTT